MMNISLTEIFAKMRVAELVQTLNGLARLPLIGCGKNAIGEWCQEPYAAS
jgi:hypothetical protein